MSGGLELATLSHLRFAALSLLKMGAAEAVFPVPIPIPLIPIPGYPPDF